MRMRPAWIGSAIAVSIATSAVDIAYAQQTEVGKDDFLKLCSGCHGSSGKGDGPNAKSLRKPPADLTRLSQNNNGRFPLVRVYDVMDGRIDIIVHGPREMPSFAEVLKKDVMSRMPRDAMSGDLVESMARKRMIEIIDYIMSLQSK
jgi:mono/diheme cytochrome c family protein